MAIGTGIGSLFSRKSCTTTFITSRIPFNADSGLSSNQLRPGNSVGQGALPKVVPLIAEGIKLRDSQSSPPLDIIIAENIRNGADYFRKLFQENGLNGNEAGLIETSIGKMVPIMKLEDLKQDPLVLHAEEYNTLVLDRKGFKNAVPKFPEIKAVENISAWVDRKLFMHNLGHAAYAYLGFVKYPEKKLIAEILEDDQIKLQVREVMLESAEALLKEYPGDFTLAALVGHIDDLLFRFQNMALGDTVFRVGRDLARKLGRDDRILGAAALCLKHNLPCTKIVNVFRAALIDLCGLDPFENEDLVKTILSHCS